MSTDAIARDGWRADLDQLRVFLCASVLLFHVLLPFTSLPFVLVGGQVRWWPAEGLVRLCHLYIMPGFFMLAGRVACGSLRRQGVPRFLLARTQRLLPPLLGGMLLVCPIIRYVGLLEGRDLRPSGLRWCEPTSLTFLEFLPRFFGRLNQATWAHLWFLAYLLLISWLLAPLLARLSHHAHRWEQRRCAPLAAYLPAGVLAVVLVVLRGWWP